MTSRHNLKKLYFINSVFPEITGNDLFYADQIRRAVEAVLEETPLDASENEYGRFCRAVMALKRKRRNTGGAFQYWDANAHREGFSPLWARRELISLLKGMAAEPHATLLVANLAEAVRPRSGRWTRKARAEYSESVAFIRELARRWSTPSSRRTLIVC